MQQCSASNNTPPTAAFKAIQARAKASIEYPADGKFVGNWKAGEAIAQSGYGLRFTDTAKGRANGGNCYACHQITRQEVSMARSARACFTTAKPELQRGRCQARLRKDLQSARDIPVLADAAVRHQQGPDDRADR
jgi:hypothetical protein